MSSNSLALTTARDRRSRNEHDPSSADHGRYWNGRSGGIPRSPYSSLEEDTPWRLFEERVRTGPHGLTRFPSQPHSPIRVLVIGGPAQDSVNPRLRRFIQSSPPRIRGEWHLNLNPAGQEDPGLTDEEFKEAMTKIRKEVYNPTPTYSERRRQSKQRSFFHSGRSGSSGAVNKAKDGEEEEEGKQCTICLEALMPKEQVLVTPCNHIFHNDCLVPWVRSHGQCPVCRFALVERKEYNNIASYGHGNNMDYEVFAPDLASLLRAMEEALNWLSLSLVSSHPLEIE